MLDEFCCAFISNSLLAVILGVMRGLLQLVLLVVGISISFILLHVGQKHVGRGDCLYCCRAITHISHGEVLEHACVCGALATMSA